MPLSFGKKVVAARALLDWNQDALASRAKITKQTLLKVEKDNGSHSQTIHEAIEHALNLNGIYLTELGVEQRENYSIILNGEDWFKRVLDDVSETLVNHHDKTLMVAFSDDRISPPHIVDKYRELRSQGIMMKQLVEEGNTYLQGDLNEYRYVPSIFFTNSVYLVYGEKVALRNGDDSCVLHMSKRLTDVFRNQFNLLWYNLNKPLITTTTAKERF